MKKEEPVDAAAGQADEKTPAAPEEVAAEPEAPDADDDAGNADDRLTELEQAAAASAAKVEEYKNRYIRLQADFENFRRRAQREKEEIARYTTEQLVLQLLPIVDNLERAMNAPGGEGDGLRQGVELILRQCQDFMGWVGVSAIEAVGQPFDPYEHEAVMQVDEPGYQEPTVVEQLQKGYKLGDKVIRPAVVKVSQ